MSIAAGDIKQLIKIVKQYEVIYGGGISSSDAAVRENCDTLIKILEDEISGKGTTPKTVTPKTSSVKTTKVPKVNTKEDEELRESTGIKGHLNALTKKITQDKNSGANEKSKAEIPASDKKQKEKPIKSPVEEKAAETKSMPPAVKLKEKEPVPTTKTVASHPEKQLPKKRLPATHLFDAYVNNQLPKYGGFIVCVYFSKEDSYTRFEVIGYENLQDLYSNGNDLVFKTAGCKLYAVAEPARYYFKGVEPVNRAQDQSIPYRFSELSKITTKRFQTMYVGQKPVFMPTSFSIHKPSGEDLAVLFYDIADVYANIMDFIILILTQRLGIPQTDARKAGELVARSIKNFKLWIDQS